jgi:polyisoprenyl-teichoic acid--peptidoglycan teichoic acid transferase
VASRRLAHWRALGARLAIALVATSVATTGVFAATHKVSDSTLDGTDKIDFAKGVLVDDDVDDDPGDPTNFLIVGSDSREEQGDASGDRFGDVGGQRSDSIMVAHVDPRAKTATMLSFPRDLVVDIPGMGRERINSAYNADRGGGPETLILTITQNFGIPINHYLEVDFAGFERIVNTIGSVDIWFPTPARDAYTGLAIQYAPGCAHLDGTQALNYVRSRHYQYLDFETETWRSDPTSDFGRIRRQQYFIRSLMHRALRHTKREPLKAFTLVDRLADMITVDSTMNIEDVKKLAKAFINSDPAAIEMLTAPTQSDGSGGLLLRAEEAQPLFDRFVQRPPVTVNVDYSEYSVDVLNANAEPGAAQIAMGELAALGFERGRVGDTGSVEATELRYSTEEGKAAAAFVQLFLGGVGELVEVDQLDADADVVLVLGPDFDAVRDPGATATSSTTEPTSSDDSTTTQTSATVPATTTTTIPPNPGEVPADYTGPIGDQRVECSGAE